MGTLEEYSKGGEVINYTPKQLAKADSLVGQKCKIYYPWKRKMIHRVVRKNMYGYYIKYEGQRRKLRLAINDFGEMVRFEIIHKRGDNYGQRHCEGMAQLSSMWAEIIKN